MASFLVCSTLDQAGQVQTLSRDTVLCSWARHFTLTVPLSTLVCKWVTANIMLGVTLMDTIQGGVEILLVASHRDKLHPDRPLGSNADYLFHHQFHLCVHSCHSLSLNHKVYKITFPPHIPGNRFTFNFIS